MFLNLSDILTTAFFAKRQPQLLMFYYCKTLHGFVERQVHLGRVIQKVCPWLPESQAGGKTRGSSNLR